MHKKYNQTCHTIVTCVTVRPKRDGDPNANHNGKVAAIHGHVAIGPLFTSLT
ncbi:hypothetical protein B0H10DRAFT_1978718, partial [Mycena sp. CBHHK59/15]